MILAIAVDEDEGLFDGHFGDAPYFLFYEDGSEQAKMSNVFIEEEHEGHSHGNPNKAKKVIEFFDGVDMLVAKEMGGNLRRVAKHFMIAF